MTTYTRQTFQSKLFSLALLSAAISLAGVSTLQASNPSSSDFTSSARGIVGTGSEVSTNGIVGTGARGIVGTGSEVSTNGIVGTGARGIVGTGSEVSTNGIVGTGARGIVGTGSEVSTNGIVGTGARGIVGTGSEVSTSGIVGTGARNRDDAEIGTLFEEWAELINVSSFPLLAYGPIEDIKEEEYVVLGQRISLTNQTPEVIYQIGETVAVFGLAYDGGILADRIIPINEASTNGSSLVFVAGLVSGEQAKDGSFQIGSATIQVGAAGTNPAAFGIKSGQFIKVTGVQIDELVIAYSINGPDF